MSLRVIVHFKANLWSDARLRHAQEVGDSVEDTPWEAQPQYACPDPPPNSCPNRPTGQPPVDPIHNFMVWCSSRT